MDIIKIILIGIVTSITSIILKQIKPELSILVVISGGLVILISLADMLTSVLAGFTNLVDSTGINKSLFSCILKIIGIGYLSEFGANVCADSGNSSLADKILLGGKIAILIVSMPIINSLINVVVSLAKWKRKE